MVFHALDHCLHIYTFSPGPWKTEISLKHSMNDHHCCILLKQLGPIYKPQGIVLAQDTIWISNLKNGKHCQSSICFLYLLFSKLVLRVPTSIPLFMLFSQLGITYHLIQILSSFKVWLKCHFFFLLIETSLLFGMAPHPHNLRICFFFFLAVMRHMYPQHIP